MNDFKFELDKNGVAVLLKSQEMGHVLESYAESAKNRCDGNYKTEISTKPTRKVAKISCADIKTYRHTLKHNDLVKAIK